MESLWTSLSAMQAGQRWLDDIGNNIANEQTPGFAENQMSFQDALTQALQSTATAPTKAGRYSPPGWWGGEGVVATPTQNNFAQMPLQQTQNPLDLALQGPGFFLVSTPSGTRLTKAGNFEWSKTASGAFELATAQGDPVLDIHGAPVLRQGAVNATFSVAPDGQVSFGGVKGQTIAIAQAPFPEEALREVSNNLFALQPGFTSTVVNGGSGAAGVAGSASASAASTKISQGALNLSNVSLVSQTADMIQAQQDFSLNEEALHLTNQMMTTAVQIRP